MLLGQTKRFAPQKGVNIYKQSNMEDVLSACFEADGNARAPRARTGPRVGDDDATKTRLDVCTARAAATQTGTSQLMSHSLTQHAR